MKRLYLPILVFFLFALVLIMSVRGISGNPESQTFNQKGWSENGPFELSPERGKFALLYSFVEDKSLQFSLPVARFATPDVGYINGHYVSLFAPGVSFIVIPGYLIGKLFGVSQLGSYLVISLFALLNSLLIYKISQKLGVNKFASMIASAVFLFATPAFAYAVSLFQHHLSTFLILFCLYLALDQLSWLRLSLIWLLIGVGITIDYPNGLMMAPIGIYTLSKLVLIKQTAKKFTLAIKVKLLPAILTIILPLALFFSFNQASFGHPFQLSATVDSVLQISQDGKPIFSLDPNVVSDRIATADNSAGFFQTRNFLNGFYIHLFSPDRGVVFYTPVILLGIFGLVLALKKKIKLTAVMVAILAINFLIYSMWGDPWGGWAFGSRYLVPSYAMLSLFLALALDQWRMKIIFLLIFYLLFLYSLAVNTLGALTSSRIPPQVEVLKLEKLTKHEEKYTYLRDVDSLNKNQSKSFLFNTVIKNNLQATYYYFLVFGLITTFSTSLLINLVRRER